MRRIFIKNEDLRVSQKIDEPINDIYQLSNEDLKKIGMMYNNGWPSKKFEGVIRTIRKINPITIEDGPKYWDSSLMGWYSIYNHAVGEYYQYDV